MAAETIAPKVETARETFVDDVLPKVAAALATDAAGAAAAKETATETAERAPDALAVLKGEAAVKRGGKGKWILLLGAIAAGAAVMAWRRSNERPDPWATAGTTTTPKPASEKVGDIAGAAKEKAAGLKDAAAEKAGAVKGRAADAKAAGTEKADTLKDKADQAKGSSTGTAAGAAAGTGAASGSTDGSDTAVTDTPIWEDAGSFAGESAPSASGTSEGSDLSTPNLEGGSTDKS